MKKKLLFVLSLCCLIFSQQGYSQVIVETFEDAPWPNVTATGGTQSFTKNVTSTAASQQITIYTNNSSSGTSTATTAAQASTGNWTWYYSKGSISSNSSGANSGNRKHSAYFSFMLGSSSGYLIAPVVNSGIASVSFWVASGGSGAEVVAGIRTNLTNNSINSGSFSAVGFVSSSSITNVTGTISQYSMTYSGTEPAQFLVYNTSGSTMYIDDIVITSPVASTSLSSSQSSLAFGNQQSSTNSISQSFDVSGALLTGAPGNLTITAPNTDFQVSNNNTTWGASTNIAYSAATLAATPVYVRFTPQTTGAKSGNVTIAGGGATTINVAVSGTGTGAIYNYRSKQTGNWSDATTWEYNNGTTWVNAVTAPSDADGSITIQTAHVVTVNAAVSADELTINTGGNITIGTGNTLTIANGIGTDITVNGTLKNSGTLTLTGTLAFGATGTYQHDATTAIPSLTWPAGSTCFVTGGTGVPSGGFGQSFANLTWNCTAQTGNVVIAATGFTVTGNFNVISTGTGGGLQMISSGGVTNSVVGSYTQTGGYVYIFPNAAARSLTCNGDFNLNGGNFGITGSVGTAGTGSATLYVKGNLSIGTGSTISKSLGITSNLEFNGTAAQTVTVSGTATIDTFNTNFNNAAGITLLSPLSLKGNTSFTTGLVTTATANILSVLGSATISGGSSTSFVNGPLQRAVETTTASSLLFPIGKSTAYSPVTLNVTQATATSTSYKAEAFLAAPATNTFPSGITKVSNTRYYAITKGTGANVTAAQVQLVYDATDATVTGISVADKTNIRIAKDNGAGAWVNLGPTVGGSANTTGTATSDINFTSFSQFVIANVTGAVPVKFISFNAQPLNDKIKLNWQVAEEINIDRYEIERSIAANSFVNIAQQQATGNNTYTAIDNLPVTGTNLYRIKAIEKSGNILYSMTVKAVKGKLSNAEIMVMPNPVKDKQLNIQLAGYEKGAYSLILYSANGTMVYNKQITVSAGSTSLQVSLPASLAKGMYQLMVTDGYNKNAKTITVE